MRYPDFLGTVRRYELAVWLDRHTGRHPGLITESYRDPPVGSWAELRNFVLEHECMVLVSDMTTAPWFTSAMADSYHVRPVAGRRGYGSPVSMRLAVHGKGRRGWIVPCLDWGIEPPSLQRSGRQWIQELRKFFSHVGTGDYRGPGGVGKEILYRQWEWEEREQAPTDEALPPRVVLRSLEPELMPIRQAQVAIKRHAHGGRVQDWAPTELAGVEKTDMSNAYAEHARRLPGGPSCILAPQRGPYLNDTPYECATWFARCTVTIACTLCLGPFAVRIAGKRKGGSLEWPTAPGTYECWLWREEAADVVAAGGSVLVHRGYYWRRWCERPAGWVDRMAWLREHAPSETVAHWVKQAIVQTIGQWGVGLRRYETVTWDKKQTGDLPIADGRYLTNWLAREVRANRGSMVHWWAYTVMQCSRSVYRMALPLAQAGSLVAIHTDCVYWREWPAEVDDGDPDGCPVQLRLGTRSGGGRAGPDGGGEHP
jgi:hypothetical protein